MSCLDEEFGFQGDSEPVEMVRNANHLLPELPSDLFATPTVTAVVVATAAQPAPRPLPTEAPVAAVSSEGPGHVYPFAMADLPAHLFATAPAALDEKPVTHAQRFPGAQPLAGAQPPTPRLGDAVELTAPGYVRVGERTDWPGAGRWIASLGRGGG